MILLVSSDPAADAAVRSVVEPHRGRLRLLGSDYGAMAVIHAAAGEASLAFIDLDPGLHGLELCRAATPHMPVIALGGVAAGHAIEADAREHGACGWLGKPLDPAQIRALLDRTLGAGAPLEL